MQSCYQGDSANRILHSGEDTSSSESCSDFTEKSFMTYQNSKQGDADLQAAKPQPYVSIINMDNKSCHLQSNQHPGAMSQLSGSLRSILSNDKANTESKVRQEAAGGYGSPFSPIRYNSLFNLITGATNQQKTAAETTIMPSKILTP